MNTLLGTPAIIEVAEISALDELESLETEWSQLWRRCPEATPFQSPEWLVAWWRHLGGGELWVLALRQEARLVGVAPLFIHSAATGRRTVLLLGTGNSDYLDALFEPGYEAAAVAAIFTHLQARHERWDLCDFQQLQACSALLQAPLMVPWTCQVTVQEVCPVLALPPQTGQLPTYIPAHMLQKLRASRRRLQRLGLPPIETARADNFTQLFEGLLQLHQARWQVRGQPGVLPPGRLQNFHREAARRLLGLGALRLYGLRADGRIGASLYGFAHGSRRYFYLSGFAPELASLSPGTLLIGHAIEEAVREGATAFDFLRGREAYKYLWGAKGRLNYRRTFELR